MRRRGGTRHCHQLPPHQRVVQGCMGSRDSRSRVQASAWTTTSLPTPQPPTPLREMADSACGRQQGLRSCDWLEAPPAPTPLQLPSRGGQAAALGPKWPIHGIMVQGLAACACGGRRCEKQEGFTPAPQGSLACQRSRGRPPQNKKILLVEKKKVRIGSKPFRAEVIASSKADGGGFLLIVIVHRLARIRATLPPTPVEKRALSSVSPPSPPNPQKTTLALLLRARALSWYLD